MRDLSCRGIARRFLGRTGRFSLRERVMGGAAGSLRARLESLARQELTVAVSDGIYGWTARYQQIWTHVVVRVQLLPDAAVTNATMETLRAVWRDGIHDTWSYRWGSGRTGEVVCPFTFEVQWVATDAHQSVRVRQGPARSNMLLWDTDDTGAVSAHEFGHMLGHRDEYPDANCPDRSPVDTGSVMDNNSALVPARMIDPFATNIGSSVVEI